MDNFDIKEYLSQGDILSSQEKYEEAIAFYDKAGALDKLNTDVYISKGIAYANLERFDEAKLEFEKALKINKTLGAAYFHLGSIAILEGNTALGMEDYNKAVSNGFDDAQVYYCIGLLYEEDGNPDLAIRNYSKAITKDAMRPDIRIRKAQLLLDGGRLPEALQALDEMILTNPDVFEGYHMKFTALIEQKQFDKAEMTLNSALELFPKDPAFILDKATLLIEQKKYNDAKAVLNALESEEESNDEVIHRINVVRAQIFSLEGDLPSAISSLEKAKVISEKHEEFDADVNFLLSTCFLSSGDFENVLSYSQAILQNVESGYIKETARYYEPFALMKLGRNDEAAAKYKDAIWEYRNQSLSSPENLEAYLFRSMCLRDIKQYDKAMELIDYVITLKPELSEPRMIKVTILEEMGKTEEAKEEKELVNSMVAPELRLQ